MPIAATYRDLEAWQFAMKLVEAIYRQTRSFPTDERFGLTSQIRRAAVSIAANIAEGKCRRTTRSFIHHVNVALGSHGEVETCLEIAARLQYLPHPERDALLVICDSTGRLMNGLLRSLEQRLEREQNSRSQRS